MKPWWMLLDSGQRTSCVPPTDQLCTTVPLITDEQQTTPIFHAGLHLGSTRLFSGSLAQKWRDCHLWSSAASAIFILCL